jgi:hypothetical protein
MGSVRCTCGGTQGSWAQIDKDRENASETMSETTNANSFSITDFLLFLVVNDA